jgi:hypothetical protein
MSVKKMVLGHLNPMFKPTIDATRDCASKDRDMMVVLGLFTSTMSSQEHSHVLYG